jgi:hypothetical protein
MSVNHYWLGRIHGMMEAKAIAEHCIRLGMGLPSALETVEQIADEIRSLSRLVYDQPVRVESSKRDRFDRIVGKVWVASPDSPCRGKPDCPMTLEAGLT